MNFIVGYDGVYKYIYIYIYIYIDNGSEIICE